MFFLQDIVTEAINIISKVFCTDLSIIFYFVSGEIIGFDKYFINIYIKIKKQMLLKNQEVKGWHFHLRLVLSFRLVKVKQSAQLGFYE